MKLLFITNVCTHYRVKTFELLARRLPVEFLFFSQGGERYWQPGLHGRVGGDFPHEYLHGFRLGPVDIAPSLVTRILRTDADVVLKCIMGRWALPAAYLATRWRGKPFVLWTGVWADLTTSFHRWTAPLRRYLYRHADAIVVYGEHVRRYLTDGGVEPEKIFIAAHALDNAVYNRPVTSAERAECRAALGLPDRRVVLYVGRFDEQKGLKYLVEAARCLNDPALTLLFVGGGERQAELARLCHEAGVAACFAGVAPTHELYRYYAIADVFVLNSITTPYGRETWGLVINEAMNQGTPVIASTAVGAAAGGLVRHGETGLVVPERNPAALAEALRQLLTDREQARQIGEAGRREVAQWTNERMVEGFAAAAEYALRVCRRRRGAA